MKLSETDVDWNLNKRVKLGLKGLANRSQNINKISGMLNLTDDPDFRENTKLR
jgi:hypothetical protein